ncbi:MAG: Yip1 family protein [candidate division Zixibacteria bacterium]|nr:Yip1 family protein [candidate division Zixibacteria bacterium]
MDLVARVRNIILTPAREWEVIKTEPISTGEMFTKYVMILAALPAIAGFIGRSLIGSSFLGEHYRVPIGSGIGSAVLWYVLTLISVYLLGVIIDMLAPSFGCARDMNASLKVAAFSWTASWLAGVFAVIPVLAILSILGLYSLYLLYVGMRSLKEVPPDKMVGYYVVTLIVALLVYVIVGVIAGLAIVTHQI